MTITTAPPKKTAPTRSITPLSSVPNGNKLNLLKRIGYSILIHAGTTALPSSTKRV